MKIIRIWITLLIIQLFVVTGLWFMSRFEYVREEESVIENVPITNNEPIQNQQNPEPVIEDKKAPVVAQIQQASNILRIQDDDLKVESLQNRENQQLKITDGIVFVSKDSQNWIEVPVHPKDLQDFWLPYLRMGEQSYYMDEERILLAYTPSKQQPHLLVRNQANIWQDITFDVDGLSIMQMSISRNQDGTYYLAMVSYEGYVTLGTSKDALTWTFTKPGYLKEAVTSSAAMNVYASSVMDDGTILIITYELDCAISLDGGKTFTNLLQDILKTDPFKGVYRIDHRKAPFDDHQGNYCVPLSDDSLLISKDGKHWEHQ